MEARFEMVGAMLSRSSLVYIAWIVIAVVALVRWKRHPKVSLLATIAAGTLFLLSLANTAIIVFGRGWRDMSFIMSIWGLFHATVSAGCWGLLAVAIFGWREPALAAAAPQAIPAWPPGPAPGAPMGGPGAPPPGRA
ncbi:MAG TPA: hypothetical protein VGQ83_21685 [Polyangia bacterium]|jgi:hypothetical protein